MKKSDKPSRRVRKRSRPESPLAHGTSRDRSAGIQHLQHGNLLYQRGQVAEAIHCFHQAVRIDPGLASAHNNLGLGLLAMRDVEQAAASFRRAIALNSSYAEAYNNLSIAYMTLGRHADAAEACSLAIQHRPQYAEAYNNLANAWRLQGASERSAESYRRALELKPHFPEARSNYARVLREQGRHEEAIEQLQAGLALRPERPQHLDLLINLAMVLRQQGRLENAAKTLQEAVRLDERCAAAYNNLGSVLVDLGQLESAVDALKHALEIEPELPEAHYNLGNAWGDLNELDQAKQSYQQALQRRPQDTKAAGNLSTILKRQGDVRGALDLLRRVDQQQADQPLWQLRMAALCPAVFLNRQEIDAFIDELRETTSRLASQKLNATSDELVRAGVEAPFNLQFFDGNLRPLKQAYAALFADHFSTTDCPKWTPSARIRIGIVVTLNNESVFLRSMRGVLQRLDARKFDITVVCSAAGHQRIREFLGGTAVEVTAMPERLDLIVELLRQSRFDILYYWEIGTDALNYFLPFFRLAPLQITSWGIQVTSGIPTVDYYLSSALVEPANAQQHYSEQLVLARTLLTYQYPDRQPRGIKSRADFGLSAAQHVYLCAQNPGKLHPDFDQVLARLLRDDAQAVIVGTADRYGFGAQQLKLRFAKTIPDAADRIILLPRQSNRDYMDLIACADVLLDPPYFGGVNTTYDALSADQPLVSLPSAFHRGRYTLGCYSKMGVSDCLVSDWDEYVALAQRLATDRDYHHAVSQNIRQAKQVLFQDDLAVQEHARIFEELIDKARENSAARGSSAGDAQDLVRHAFTLHQQGQLEAAASCLRQTISMDPTCVAAHGGLGNVYKQQQRLEDAIGCYQRVLEIDPRRAEAHNNLANCLRIQNRLADAERHYRLALVQSPDSPEICNNLGCVYRETGDAKQAVQCFQRALDLRPDYLDALNNLGTTLAMLNRLEEAAACYRQSLELEADQSETLLNLATVLAQLGDVEAAGIYHRRLIQLEPLQPLHRLRLNAVWPTVFNSSDECTAYLSQLEQAVDDLSGHRLTCGLDQIPSSICPPPLPLQFLAGNLRSIKQKYAAALNWLLPGQPPPVADLQSRPRIGMVVTARHERAFIQSLGGVLQRLNTQDFDLLIFCSATGARRIRQDIRRDDLTIVHLPARFEQMIEAVRASGLHVLYHWEIGSDPVNYFLPFAPLAPVQCTSWGLQVTSGIARVGFYLSSSLIERPDAAEHYSEQLLLARTLLTWQNRKQRPTPGKTRSDFGFSPKQHLYVCAQHLGKFHPDFDALLLEILRRDEQALVVVTEDRYGWHARRLRQRLVHSLGDMSQRVQFLPQLEQPDYLSLLQLADVLLDPPHFGGVNSTYDGLSLGKAIVTLPTAFHRGRYTLGCYRKMGLSDCVAVSPEQYVAQAVALGTNPDQRRQLERRISEASGELFEDRESVTEHERLFQELITHAQRC